MYNGFNEIWFFFYQRIFGEIAVIGETRDTVLWLAPVLKVIQEYCVTCTSKDVEYLR